MDLFHEQPHRSTYMFDMFFNLIRGTRYLVQFPRLVDKVQCARQRQDWIQDPHSAKHPPVNVRLRTAWTDLTVQHFIQHYCLHLLMNYRLLSLVLPTELNLGSSVWYYRGYQLKTALVPGPSVSWTRTKLTKCKMSHLSCCVAAGSFKLCLMYSCCK